MTWLPEWRVTIGDDVYTTVTSVSYATGRLDIDRQCTAGYCRVEIINTDNSAFTINVTEPVTLELKNSSGTYITVFSGEVSDFSIGVRSPEETGYITTGTILGIGSLAKLTKAIYNTALSEGLDGAQISAILSAALNLSWAEVLFTTNDVANILRVDKSTVKRWTDEGILKCFRTPGGHRKFRSEDLYNFVSENNYGNQSLQALPQLMSDEMIIRSIVQKKEFNVLHSVCFSAAIKGKKQEILTLFTECMNAGLSVTALFDNVVKPTAKKLGFLQAQDKLTVSEFHLAQNVLTSAIIHLNELATKKEYKHKTVVCASIENGRNDIELAAVVTMLEANGYTAMNLGSGINAEAINQFVIRTKPFAVCHYTTFTANSEQLNTELKKVAELSKSNGSHCIVGGDAFNSETVKRMEDVTFCASFAEIESMQFGNVKSLSINTNR